MTSKMLRLFVNTLTADDKYSLLNRDNLMQPMQMNLSHKQKNFSEHTCKFLKFTLNFEHFQNKITPIAYIFPKLRTPKDGLDKCLKSPVSEDLSRGNIVNGRKHCLNLNDSTLTILIAHCEDN